MNSIEIKDLKKGQVVYEHGYGRVIQAMCLEDAHLKNGGWACKVQGAFGEYELFALDSPAGQAYAPRLYTEPN